jgi:hypothetical protein
LVEQLFSPIEALGICGVPDLRRKMMKARRSSQRCRVGGTSAVALLLASTTALATPTTVDRNEFVDSYVATCGHDQGIAQFSERDRREFCGCAADRMWSLTTDEDAAYLKAHDNWSPSIAAKVEQAAKECKYLLPGR